jgi:hypothetical protein
VDNLITDELEIKLGLEPGFFIKLTAEDDWSFVIKLHALLEAACTDLLLFHFKEPALAEIFARMELSDKARGKLRFLEQLELISKRNRRFISALSELRNSIVHDIKKHSFSLNNMVESFTQQQLKAFTVNFNPLDELIRQAAKDIRLKGAFEEFGQAVDLNKRMLDAKRNPKSFIWMGALNVIRSFEYAYEYSEYRSYEKSFIINGLED